MATAPAWRDALAQADHAVASYEPDALPRAMQRVATEFASLEAAAAVPPTELQSAYRALSEFHARCAYLKAQLSAALQAAATPPDSFARYTPFGAATKRTHSFLRKAL